jgi:hypothetical protein
MHRPPRSRYLPQGIALTHTVASTPSATALRFRCYLQGSCLSKTSPIDKDLLVQILSGYEDDEDEGSWSMDALYGTKQSKIR